MRCLNHLAFRRTPQIATLATFRFPFGVSTTLLLAVGRVGHFSDFCVLEAKIPCLLSLPTLISIRAASEAFCKPRTREFWRVPTRCVARPPGPRAAADRAADVTIFTAIISTLRCRERNKHHLTRNLV